nr:immunoglobulin light chain junction region [Macaca mulatta]MOX51078.1 immunoglobulin light chain junction region [Macaca mulatta]MOX51367.1 immunoglobulin light chain junction region [Macaca mulatta]
CQQHHSHPPTF